MRNNVQDIFVETVFTKYNKKAGPNSFCKAGEDKIINEMKKMHKMEVIYPMDLNNLNREEKKSAK